jgi:hypothetical protein
MAAEWTQVRNALVLRDDVLTHRWYDAFGPNVKKWEFDAGSVVSTTTATGQTVTVTNGTLVTADSTTGGAIVLTLAGADNDKVEVQSTTEAFYFANKYPAYYGCKFRLVDLDQTDVHAGFCIRDTDLAGGLTDGLYFRIVDEATAISLVLEKDSGETATVLVAAGADLTDYTLELYYDGAYVYAYVNGVLAATVAVSNASFPNDEDLTPHFEFTTGAVAVETCQIAWLRAIQIQQ